MNNFDFYSPTYFAFGKDREQDAGALVKRFGGTKVLIHYGGGSVVRSGLLDRIKASLDAEGVAWLELGGVKPNPRSGLVYEGIELCRHEGVDFVLAVGGGSTIDSSKAIAAGTVYDGDFWDFYSGKYIEEALPVGTVLTISAAGSETSNSCVITNEETGEKRSYDDDIARPKFAVMNPELTMTLPDWQTESGCTDIMMHTMERYFIPGSTCDLTDEIAEGLLRTVISSGRKVLADPSDFNAMGEVMWASSLSHNDLTGCGRGKDFSIHKFGHALTAAYDVTHGASLTCIWPAWASYLYKDAFPRFSRFARKVWNVSEPDDEKAARIGINMTSDFFREIGMPLTIAELGYAPSDEDIHALALNATKNDTVTLCRIRPLHAAECEEIFRLAR